MNKKFTAKQVYILVFAIVVGISFVETSGGIKTSEFWKEFIFNIVGYGIIVELIVIILASFSKE